MSDTVQTLITQLIGVAKAQGLSQAQLAERAGLSAVGLSKAKHRGDLRASTLVELARQLDLQLQLVPRQPTTTISEAIKSGTFFQRLDKSTNRKS